MKPSDRLAELSLTLPEVTAPIGSYVPAIRTGSLILTSGQLPIRDGTLTHAGKVPTDVSIEDAAEGSAIAALNAVAAAAQVAGGIDAIKRVIKLAVFVNSEPDFTAQPQVANGASELLFKIFDDAGRHARAAVGVAALPLGAAIELELTVEV